jgi:hypothetical protein
MRSFKKCESSSAKSLIKFRYHGLIVLELLLTSLSTIITPLRSEYKLIAVVSRGMRLASLKSIAFELLAELHEGCQFRIIFMRRV